MEVFLDNLNYIYQKKVLMRQEVLKRHCGKVVQVKPHDVFGYRSKVQAYEVLEDIDVATSITKANPQWGKGGATQIFVENFETVLQAKGNPIILI